MNFFVMPILFVMPIRVKILISQDRGRPKPCQFFFEYTRFLRKAVTGLYFNEIELFI
jgi:hypothetical protein